MSQPILQAQFEEIKRWIDRGADGQRNGERNSTVDQDGQCTRI